MRLSFYIGGAVFIAAVLVTVLTTKEYSPEELKDYSEEDSGRVSNENADDTALGSGIFYRLGRIG